MIDLHTHTDESDGTFTPEQLVNEAARIGLEALAITDHDTFTGYDLAVPHAARRGLELVCGIELSTRYHDRSVHLLAYFLKNQPDDEFRQWVVSLQSGRQRRNEALVEKLCSQRMPVTFAELAVHGRKLIARPHFAAVMTERGYVSSREEAFEKYLDESGSCFVSREEPSFAEVVSRIRACGGLPVLPHPVRLKTTRNNLETVVSEMCESGLAGIEAYHSDHSEDEMDFYASIARRFKIAVTGGSDFHGGAKPRVSLGTGIGGRLKVHYRILDELRRVA
jgi:predicted metal-dependent phosphoesterase TrpH